jgi:hypothetical protein
MLNKTFINMEKIIKLHRKHQPLTRGGFKIVPWLTLSGKWLAENGFRVGDTVTITIEQDQLTVKTNKG